MPYQLLSVEAVADYLHLTPADIQQRVKDHEIPFEKRGDRIVFRKGDIDAWASQRILGFAGPRLAVYHEHSTRRTRKILPHEAILPEMLAAGAVASAMTSKTKSSILRDLVAVADKTGQLNDTKTLIESLEAREELCSTAVPGGFAVPHPRAVEPYLFETSFIVVGRPIQEIHFGSPDGEPTHLFFLLCCQDDRLHLHTLARLCLIALKTRILEQLRDAPDAQTMREALIAAEQEILTGRKLFKAHLRFGWRQLNCHVEEFADILCPYCGQNCEVVIDTSLARQRFTTDCEVCCRPFEVVAKCEAGEIVNVEVSAE